MAVEVEAVIPDADPTEPCLEEETVRLLREVESRARKKVRITHAQSHASLAAQFLGEFVGDEDLLRAVQFHEERDALWHRATSRTRPNLARFDDLLAIIRD